MLWIFPARKIRRLRSGANPRSWVPEASMLTPRPPKTGCLSISAEYFWLLTYGHSLILDFVLLTQKNLGKSGNSLYGICGGQCGAWTEFTPPSAYILPQYHSSGAPHSFICPVLVTDCFITENIHT
jgi:hypothetical protein